MIIVIIPEGGMRRFETLIELKFIKFELFELILLLKLDKHFPVEQFEAQYLDPSYSHGVCFWAAPLCATLPYDRLGEVRLGRYCSGVSWNANCMRRFAAFMRIHRDKLRARDAYSPRQGYLGDWGPEVSWVALAPGLLWIPVNWMLHPSDESQTKIRSPTRQKFIHHHQWMFTVCNQINAYRILNNWSI